MDGPTSAAQVTREDRILPITRIVAGVVLVILALAFLVLYLNPDRTEEHFAWPIDARMTAILMGAGYGSAMVFFVAVLVGRRWHRVTLGFLPTTVFAWTMAVTTLLHWDRFSHGTAPFLLWAWVYAITPLLVPAVWLVNRRRDPGTAEARDVVIGGVLRAVLAAAGLLLAGLALLMMLAPSVVIEVWPWPLTPLTARTVAAFVALPAVAWLVMAADRRWSAARVMVATVAVGMALLLVGAWRAWGEFDQTSWLAYLYVAGVAGTLAALVTMWVYLQRAATRREGAAPPRSAPTPGVAA